MSLKTEGLETTIWGMKHSFDNGRELSKFLDELAGACGALEYLGFEAGVKVDRDGLTLVIKGSEDVGL